MTDLPGDHEDAPAPGVVVRSVSQDSPASRIHLAPGDRILNLNGKAVRDLLDLYFLEGPHELLVELADRWIWSRKEEGEPLGITIEPTPDLACKESCLFCFVHQNPKGLRRALYFKDDDYRLSFLHGNFITLTDAPPGAIERILEQRLSPLYVSIHSTDEAIRGELLGAKGAAPILPIIERLSQGGIRLFCQIVVVPGYNDGEELERTLGDLLPIADFIPAIAVVPLGLTDHRKGLPCLEPFRPRHAMRTLASLDEFRRKTLPSLGRTLAFAADEIYLLAGVPVPKCTHYEGFPLIEDGIGMVRRFEDEMEAGLPGFSVNLSGRRIALLSGTLFAKTLKRYLDPLRQATGGDFMVIAARNLLFGPGVTVAGLLSGRCIRAALARTGQSFDLAFVSGEVENADGLLLDDTRLEEISAQVGFPVVSGGSGARALLDRLTREGG